MKNGKHLFNVVYLSLVFTVLLVACRVIYSGNTHYIFLLWNLFLAWIPFELSRLIAREKRIPPILQIFLLIAWLLFFPNAPYIITDFLHLGESPFVPLWFDVLLLFSASWNGLFLGLLSLLYIERFMEAKFNSRIAEFSIICFLFLGGFGVYAGRYLRWNSWEVFTRPEDIARDTLVRLLYPLDHPNTWAITFLFGMLLSLIYLMVKQLKQFFITNR